MGTEARALRPALEARGVRRRKPVLYARVWNGFAATVDANDLPELRALGLRAEPVRRFYGAAGATGRSGARGRSGPTGGSGPSGGAGPTGGSGPSGGAGPPGGSGSSGPTSSTGPTGPSGSTADAERGGPSVALLDSGVDRAAPGLTGRVVRGFDAVGGRPAPRERHGTQVAQVL